MLYTFHSIIGSGGFGRVERVIGDNGYYYARKVFAPTPAVLAGKENNIDKLRKRFIREYKTQKELNSQYIMPVIEANLEGDTPYFIMPLADGTFQDKIQLDKKNGLVDFDALFDILNGLEYLHEHGFTHRDLKPANILFFNGSWRLTDFGLIQINSSETTQLTSANSGWGSLPYAAPEQSKNFKSVNNLVDIYSFGCIIHDYYDPNPHFRTPFAKHTTAGDAGIFIEKCTDEKPSKRFQNISSTRSALSKLRSNFSQPKTKEAKDWQTKILNYSSVPEQWTEDDLRDLIHFINRTEESDVLLILNSMESTFIEMLYHTNINDWNELALHFCEYTISNSFGFDYCDVLVNKLMVVYSRGDFKIKAHAAVAVANLGSTHNRWYVMRHAVRMCGKGIEDKLASRIAIEIKINDCESHFLRCLNMYTHCSLDDFHPIVANVLGQKS